MKKRLCYGMYVVALALTACSLGYSLVSVEGERVPVTKAYDVEQDMKAWRMLQPYQEGVDSIMKPVIGHAARKLEVYRPESPLSNLLADVLRTAAEVKTGMPADVGVMNMGGIRSLLNEGEVTVASVYEITPFENHLVVVTLKGKDLQELFRQMAGVHGEGLSGARLVISESGNLLSAKVGGKDIDPEKDYQVATIDYLAEGNDHLSAFKEAVGKLEPENAVLRDLFIDYVKKMEALGKCVDAKVEGRIVEQ